MSKRTTPLPAAAPALPAFVERRKADFIPGFGVQSLRNFRQHHTVFPGEEIRSTPWSELTRSHLKALMRVPLVESWQLFASRYQPRLPTEAELQAALVRSEGEQ